MNTTRLITVFGGSGFVGRHVVRALALDGWRIRVASRRPELAFFLPTLGTAGQICTVQANMRYPDSVAAAMRGATAVVNLSGILAPSGRQTFDGIHRFGAAALADAAKAEGITNLVHVSAIGADVNAASAYARSKAEGEAAVRETVPDAVIARPSLVFGPEDDFFNRFAAMARLFPGLPLIGGGHTKFQPVYVGDVAKFIAKAAAGEVKSGTVHELGGPEIKTFHELLAYICEVTGRRRLLMPLPFGLASLMARSTEIASSVSLGLYPPLLAMTRDQVTLLKSDNIVSAAAMAEKRTLQGAGIEPETIAAIVPTYLARFRRTGQFAVRGA
ncbi:MAG: complex I NDUFA9 subunit family protein [Hyphomicrobiales bacterium]|nr:complex I NDUFA9 subunit family protein [Hyphomicrobiales bacterium]